MSSSRDSSMAAVPSDHGRLRWIRTLHTNHCEVWHVDDSDERALDAVRDAF